MPEPANAQLWAIPYGLGAGDAALSNYAAPHYAGKHMNWLHSFWGVVPILTAFFAYCAVESTTIPWASTYLATDRGVEAATAAAFGALFLLGITAGRFLAGFVADHFGDRALIRGGFLTVIADIALIALPLPTEVFTLAGLVIAGLGCAPIYSAINHSTPASFGRRNSHAIIGIQMAAAHTGSTLAPPPFGAPSAWAGLWMFPLYLAAIAIPGLAMSERLNRRVDAELAGAEAGSSS